LKYVLALIAAYLITGAIYVRRKLTENNYLRVPPFLMRYRAEGGKGLLVAVTLSWPLATFINREFAYWLTFTILAAVGLYLSST
jgi:hypothetical protein